MEHIDSTIDFLSEYNMINAIFTYIARYICNVLWAVYCSQVIVNISISVVPMLITWYCFIITKCYQPKSPSLITIQQVAKFHEEAFLKLKHFSGFRLKTWCHNSGRCSKTLTKTIEIIGPFYRVSVCGVIRSMRWMLMTGLLLSPGHHPPCYWLHN